MGLKAALAALASAAPVPVFAVAGAGSTDAVRELRLRQELALVASPRAANILLVAGHIPDEIVPALRSVHDSISHPRATVLWQPAGLPGSALGEALGSPAAITDDPVPAIVDLHRQLLTGARSSEPPLLPDVDPAPWRGVGPFGQGGAGMTGGVPYGRPLADRADDRDGLTLDQLPVRVGPFFPPLPPGLIAHVRLHGDLIRQVDLSLPARSDRRPGSFLASPGDDPFLRAVDEPMPIAELELARARSHLRWICDGLLAQGLDALAARALKLSVSLRPEDVEAVRQLGRAIRRTGATSWSTAGLGLIDPAQLKGLGSGPAARAAGLAEDVRLEDPVYRSLGFEPLLESGGDTAARWKQRLGEAAQALELCAVAGGRSTSITGRVESPRGELRRDSHPSERLLKVAEAALVGRDWGEAVSTLVSLDLDPWGIHKFDQAGLPDAVR